MELAENIKRVRRPKKSFIFSVVDGELFELNEVGDAILDKIDEGLDEKGIVEYLHKETGEDIEIIKQDLKEFIEELKQKKFLI